MPVAEPEVGAESEIDILNVDDETARQSLKDRHLRQLRATGHSVGSTEDATRWLVNRFRTPNNRTLILLLDLMFPDNPRPGLDLVSKIRAGLLEGVPRDLAIVIYSAADSDQVMREAYRLGANAFVVKGGDPRLLVGAIETYTGRLVRAARTLCEILSIDLVRHSLRVRIRGTDDWVAERSFDLDLCPIEARHVGATFYLDTFKQFRAGTLELKLKGHTVDATEDARILAELLDDPS